MNYEVTIAMPVFNTGNHIRRALLSALMQTFRSIEILLIDDRGSDDSIEIARSILADHPRRGDVRIIDHGVNRGTGATKNTAMDEAQGRFLFFMDSDDVITSDCIERMYEAIMRDEVDFVAASFRKVNADGTQVMSEWRLPSITRHEPYALSRYIKADGERFYVMTWNKLYSMDFLRRSRIRCIPHHLNEDVWFTFQLEYMADSFTFLSQPTYDWYTRADSTTHSMINQGIKPQKVEQFLEIMHHMQNAVCDDERARRCPYLVDEVVAFSMALVENILRSALPGNTKHELILRVADLTRIRGHKARRLGNRITLGVFQSRSAGLTLGYMNAIRYARGARFALRHPMRMIGKKLGIGNRAK